MLTNWPASFILVIMWLINVKTKALEAFVDDSKPVPPYAILSHTWGPDREEISFQELQNGKRKEGLGQYKFDECCFQATHDGLSYAWIDTCCIDKTNSTELGEAINSMFKWYEDAQVCYAYLCDVDANEEPLEPESSFWRSRWFQRGWTLQELIAPANVRFYDARWSCLGTKRDLAPALVPITGIPRIFLLGALPLHRASVAQRMSWASRRVTKRKEDLAYCLLGIFGIMMPMIYGEGDRAFIRLQEEILRHIRDDSILAWNFSNESSANESSEVISVGAFARSPSSFAGSNHIVPTSPGRNAFEPLYTRGSVLLVQRGLHIDASGQYFIILQCQLDDIQGRAVGIPVQAQSGGDCNYIRQGGQPCMLLPKDEFQTVPQDIRILVGYSDTEYNQHLYVLYIENALERDLELTEVIPHSSWDQEKDMLILASDTSSGRPYGNWAMFRHKHDRSGDFILVFDTILRRSELQVRYHLMTCDRGIKLDEIRDNLASFNWCGHCELNNHTASNGALSLQATVTRVKFGDQNVFSVELLRIEDAPNTYNVTKALLRLLNDQRSGMAGKSSSKPEIDGEDWNEAAANEMVAKLPRSLSFDTREDYEQVSVPAHRLLLAAAQAGYEPPFQQIAKRGININIATAHGRNLMMSAAMGGNKRIVQILLALGADFERPSESAQSTLHVSSDADITRLLLHYGAEIDKESSDGVTALMVAAASGNEAVVKVLVEHEANMERKGSLRRHRHTTLILGAFESRDVFFRIFYTSESALIKKISDEITALMLAVIHNHEPVVRVLVEHGAKMEKKNSNGYTALMLAALGGYEDIAKILVEHGAELEERDPKGRTALTIAVDRRSEGVVRVLVEYGAKMEERNSERRLADERFSFPEPLLYEGVIIGRTPSRPAIDNDEGAARDVAGSGGNDPFTKLRRSYASFFDRVRGSIIGNG